MSIRHSVHELVDELADDELELAKQMLEEIRAGEFDLTEADRAELVTRANECERGEWVDARTVLSALREHGDDADR
jgi:hypothetical protein